MNSRKVSLTPSSLLLSRVGCRIRVMAAGDYRMGKVVEDVKELLDK